MNTQDFVYNHIYKTALKGGAKERSAHRYAQVGLDVYKKNKFSGKVSDHIDLYVNMAIKESKQARK